MTTYALDTNIISYFLREDNTVVSRVRSILNAGNKLIIPPLVYYEVTRGLLLKDARKQTSAFNKFCQHIPIGEMNLRVLDIAAKIYVERNRTVGDTDTLIAAFCIVNGYILVTHNTKDFKDIENLQIVDWTK